MNVQILQMLEGAKQARGLTVIIDVFRAFSVECYAFSRGAKTILPVGGIDEAFALKEKYPDALLVGERNGVKCEGFDCGNSPSQMEKFDVKDRMIIHTTSAGTQGIANAVHATETLAASLVNARATAEYIRKRNPEMVSLVCMGLNATSETEEDTLCAEYIAALLRGEKPDISAEIADLANTSGKKFFDPANAEVFPQKDFEMSTQLDRFPFALKVNRGAEGVFVESICAEDLPPTEEELIAYAKMFLKQRGFKKKGKRWTKEDQEFTQVFFIQGSAWDKNDYYVRPGVFINALMPSFEVYGHVDTEISGTTSEQILQSAMSFFDEWTNKALFRERVRAFAEWEQRNPLEKRRAGEVNYQKDPVPAEELFGLSEDVKRYVLENF